MHSGFLDILIPFIIQYRYFLILPAAIFEGPIISIICGFLIAQGHFEFIPIYAVLVIGDLIGDSLYYAIGRYGRERMIQKLSWLIGLNEDRLDVIEKYIYRNLNKTFVFGKFVHGLGAILWVTTGLVRVPFNKFLFANAITTCIKTFLLLTAGFFFGWAYNSFDLYFRYASLTFLILFILFYLTILKTNFFSKLFPK